MRALARWACGLGPLAPRVVLERRPRVSGLELVDQLLAELDREAAATPTWWSRPSSSNRPSSSEPTPSPSLCMRNPATTQSAVRSCLTLNIVRLSGVYGPSSRLAITPSRPAPSKRANQSRGDVRVGGRRREVDRRRRRRSAPSSSVPPLAQRRVEQRAVVEGEEVEGDERGRRLARQPPHPRLGRVDALLQGVEVEAVAAARRRHHDLAVDDAASGSGRLERLDQLGEVARERPFVAAGRARARRRRGTRCTGSRPTSARRASRRPPG